MYICIKRSNQVVINVYICIKRSNQVTTHFCSCPVYWILIPGVWFVDHRCIHVHMFSRCFGQITAHFLHLSCLWLVHRVLISGVWVVDHRCVSVFSPGVPAGSHERIWGADGGGRHDGATETRHHAGPDHAQNTGRETVRAECRSVYLCDLGVFCTCKLWA